MPPRDYGQAIAALFRMDEDTWARHASPWSVYTRIATLPLIVLALWSRAWLGWWCLVPLAFLGVWTWLNPRAFAVPERTNNWASKAVFGERVWLARGDVPIPAHHQRAALLLSILSATGLPILAYGLVVLDPGFTLFGWALVQFGKLWFVDRMVWLYEDMKDASPVYRSWLKR